MIKAILTAAACCVLLGGCVAWGRGGDGFYPILVQKPDPRYPNVFVYPPTIDRGGYAVVDQDPIVIRRGAKTTVSWAVDALSGYVFRDIEFRDPATGSRLETKDFCRETEWGRVRWARRASPGASPGVDGPCPIVYHDRLVGS